MKKKVLFVLIPLLACGLSSCVMYNGQGKPGANKSSAAQQSEEPTSQVASSVIPPASEHYEPIPDVPEGASVKVYLVFGEYGQYKGEAVESRVPAPLYLEHAIEMDARVGDALPGKDDVTSIVEGSEFVAWVAYLNDGNLTEFTAVPNVDRQILYASFSGGKGGDTGYNPIPEPPQPVEYTESSTGALPSSGFGFKFSDNSYMDATKADEFDGYQQYVIRNRAFKKDQVFSLYDFANKAGWVVDVDPYAFGGTSIHSENWKAYLSKGENTYTVLQDFNVESVYIKIKENADQVYFQLA